MLHINAFIYSFADGNKNFKIKTDMKNLYISPNIIIFIIRRVECIHYFSLMKIFITTVFICRNMLLCCMIKVLLGKRTNCNSFFLQAMFHDIEENKCVYVKSKIF